MHGPIRLNFELRPDFMVVILPGKNEEDSIRVFTTLHIDFSDAQGQLAWILPKFNLIQAFTHFLVTCKNEEDPIKTKGLEYSQHFPNYKSVGFFQTIKGS